MMKLTWVIIGATSIIASEFAHLVAKQGHALLLIGRDSSQLKLMAADFQLRYHGHCDVIAYDLSENLMPLITQLQQRPDELALFIAASSIIENSQLTPNNIETLITINITHTITLIHQYLQKSQQQHRLIFLSSVAACRGRAKNSLYGASKAAVDIYLEGLQQERIKHRFITIVRAGFIDTLQTFGLPGVFYASPPASCAKACLQAANKNKRRIYHPFFWRYIMFIITRLPFFLYQRLKDK